MIRNKVPGPEYPIQVPAEPIERFAIVHIAVAAELSDNKA